MTTEDRDGNSRREFLRRLAAVPAGAAAFALMAASSEAQQAGEETEAYQGKGGGKGRGGPGGAGKGGKGKAGKGKAGGKGKGKGKNKGKTPEEAGGNQD